MRRHFELFSRALVVLFISVPAAWAVNVDFDNDSTDGDWNTAANWTNNAVPTVADNVFIGDTVAGPTTVTISASPLNPIGELGLGRNLSGTYTINQIAGNVVTNNWTNIGQGFGAGDSVGIYNISGGSLTKNGGGNNAFGALNDGRGELYISNNALWRINSGFSALGGENAGAANSDTVGIVEVNDTGRFENPGGIVYVGRAGTGTFTHNSTNTSQMHSLEIANNAQGMGTVNVTAGTLEVLVGDIQIGRGNTTNTPELNISGGFVDHARNTVIGRDGRGVINLTGGQFDTGRLIVGEGNNVSSTLNISGDAVLNSQTIENIGGAAAATINITGSQASINIASGALGNGDLEVNEGPTALSFFADASGVSTINVENEASIGTTDLLVDLTGFGFGGGNLDLIDYGTLDGNFNSVDVLFDAMPLTPGVAGNLADFEYALDVGSGTGDTISLEFQLPNVPEPGALAIWLAVGSIGVGVGIRRCRRRSTRKNP